MYSYRKYSANYSSIKKKKSIPVLRVSPQDYIPNTDLILEIQGYLKVRL